jgi:hypothetical protein
MQPSQSCSCQLLACESAEPVRGIFNTAIKHPAKGKNQQHLGAPVEERARRGKIQAKPKPNKKREGKHVSQIDGIAPFTSPFHKSRGLMVRGKTNLFS